MPGVKISALTETTSPQTTDEFVVQRGGSANYRLKLTNIPLTSISTTGLTAGKPLQVNSGGTAVESASDTGTGAIVRAMSPTISSPVVSSPTISGNFNLSVTTITSSTTAGDYTTYIIDAQSGNVTLTLPSAATYTSRRYTIMRIDTYQHSSKYKAIVAAASGQTINGVGLINLANYDSITAQSNGTNWVIVGGGMS